MELFSPTHKPKFKPTGYILGIEFNPCSKEESEFCVYKLSKGSCVKAIQSCLYPIKENPLCLCKRLRDCPQLYSIIDYKKKKFILYKCKRCKYFIKDFKNAIETLLKPLNSDTIFYGKELADLVKKIIPKGEDMDEVTMFLEYFEHAFDVLNRGI